MLMSVAGLSQAVRKISWRYVRRENLFGCLLLESLKASSKPVCGDTAGFYIYLQVTDILSLMFFLIFIVSQAIDFE